MRLNNRHLTDMGTEVTKICTGLSHGFGYDSGDISRIRVRFVFFAPFFSHGYGYRDPCYDEVLIYFIL